MKIQGVKIHGNQKSSAEKFIVLNVHIGKRRKTFKPNNLSYHLNNKTKTKKAK